MDLGIGAGAASGGAWQASLQWFDRGLLVLGTLFAAWLLARWVPGLVRWQRAVAPARPVRARAALGLLVVVLLLMIGAGVGFLAVDLPGRRSMTAFVLGGLLTIAVELLRAAHRALPPDPPPPQALSSVTYSRIQALWGVGLLLWGLDNCFNSRG